MRNLLWFANYQSKALSSDDLSRLDNAIKAVEESAAQLAKAVDGKDQAATESSVKRLATALDLIAS